MVDAKKCDACGAFYTKEEMTERKFLVDLGVEKGAADLCNSCNEQLENLMNGKPKKREIKPADQENFKPIKEELDAIDSEHDIDPLLATYEIQEQQVMALVNWLPGMHISKLTRKYYERHHSISEPTMRKIVIRLKNKKQVDMIRGKGKICVFPKYESKELSKHSTPAEKASEELKKTARPDPYPQMESFNEEYFEKPEEQVETRNPLAQQVKPLMDKRIGRQKWIMKIVNDQVGKGLSRTEAMRNANEAWDELPVTEQQRIQEEAT